MNDDDNQEYVGVRLAWKRIIAIAQDLPDPAAAIHNDTSEQQQHITASTKHARLYAMSKALQHMFIITSQMEGYIAFISTMTKELDACCPTSLAFVKHILEHAALPTPTTLKTISSLLINNNNNNKSNGYLLWSILAHQFAGHLAYVMWSDAMYDVLLTSISSASYHPTHRLYALLVFESFSLTGQLKTLFLNKRLHHTLRHIKRDMDRTKWTQRLCFSRQDPWWIETRQFQFALEWSLSHVFNENPTTSRPTLKIINYNKYRLEVRNDVNQQFEPIYISDALTKGRWYYEVQILTDGIIQLGLCNKNDSQKDQGFGIGNTNNGFAFDTYQSGIWIGENLQVPKSSGRQRCSKGDVIGCLIDMDNNTCVYSINGHEFGIHVQLGATEGVVPIVYLTQYQHVRINTGSWLFCSHRAKSLKRVQHQHLVSSTKTDQDSEDAVLCILCFSETKDIVLFPCRHEGFGYQCAEKLTTCPLCRAPIKDKKFLTRL